MATDAAFGPDGTQDPLPPPVFPDPLSGLVTGELYVTELLPAATPPVRPPVIVPTSPAPDVMAAVIAEEAARRRPPPRRQLPRRTRQPVLDPGPPARFPDAYAPTGPIGLRSDSRARLARRPRISAVMVVSSVLLILVGVIVFQIVRGVIEQVARLFH